MPLDIALGIFLAFLVHVYFDVLFTIWLALAGIAAALVPDIDIVTAAFGKWRHREFTHYPLTYIPFIIAAFAFVPHPYAVLLASGILAHFIHDTIGTGWGIAWLWPFTPRRLLLLPDGSRRKQMGVFASWLPEEHPEWAHQGPHTWVRDTYFRLSAVSIIEYGVLFLVLLTLAAYLW